MATAAVKNPPSILSNQPQSASGSLLSSDSHQQSSSNTSLSALSSSTTSHSPSSSSTAMPSVQSAVSSRVAGSSQHPLAAMDFRPVIKARHGQHIRRIPMAKSDMANLTLSELYHVVGRSFSSLMPGGDPLGASSHQLKYKDSENEWISIIDDSDLSYAVTLGPCLHIDITEKNECSVEDMARKFSNVSVCSSSLSSLKGQVGKTLSQLQNLLDIIEKTLSKEHHDKSSMLFDSSENDMVNEDLPSSTFGTNQSMLSNNSTGSLPQGSSSTYQISGNQSSYPMMSSSSSPQMSNAGAQPYSSHHPQNALPSTAPGSSFPRPAPPPLGSSSSSYGSGNVSSSAPPSSFPYPPPPPHSSASQNTAGQAPSQPQSAPGLFSSMAMPSGHNQHAAPHPMSQGHSHGQGHLPPQPPSISGSNFSSMPPMAGPSAPPQQPSGTSAQFPPKPPMMQPPAPFQGSYPSQPHNQQISGQQMSSQQIPSSSASSQARPQMPPPPHSSQYFNPPPSQPSHQMHQGGPSGPYGGQLHHYPSSQYNR